MKKIICCLILLLSFPALAMINYVGLLDELLSSDKGRAFNGVVLIAKDDHIIYQKASGAYGRPQIDSQFLIGSISKQFTACVLLALVEQGLVDLDAPIKQYLPELTEFWVAKAKVKHLLNHTSGIVDVTKPLEFEPGAKFKYSSTLTYYLVSKIAEKASGKKYEDLLANLFQKAYMRNSVAADTVDIKKLYQKYLKLVHGYKQFQKSVLTRDEWLPGAGIISTAVDLLQWNLALHGGKLLSQKTYEKMITPSAIRENYRYGNVGYGFGVQILDQDNLLEISHSGYGNGYISTLIYYPESKMSVIILENVSEKPKNMTSAFKVHDQVRQIMRRVNLISKNMQLHHKRASNEVYLINH
jgi:CubicO group peptidase (beta-lactamase class C family)